MCRQEFSERPDPQGTGLIFSADPTAEGFEVVLHLVEHPTAPSYVPGDVDLPMLEMDLAVSGIGPNPEVREESGREISLQ
jgi:hypothetical protein